MGGFQLPVKSAGPDFLLAVARKSMTVKSVVGRVGCLDFSGCSRC